jgi:hypothetical protein
MDNQHRKIKGYRELSVEEIAVMNRIKEKGAELRSLIEEVNSHLDRGLDDEEVCDRISQADAYFWLNSAEADLKVGIMKLVRAVAQPEGF